MSEFLPTATKRQVWILVAIMLIGAAIRISVDDLREFADTDEGTYINNTRLLADQGWRAYPSLSRGFVEDPGKWVFPNPLRWGYYLLTTAACRCSSRCDGRVLAGLSTLAGIVSLLLTFLLGTELLGTEVGLLAAGLSVTSPLQLALGRRALQDEVFCASVLLSFWLVALVRRRPRPLLYAAAIAATTLTLAVKESALLLFPALAVLSFAGRGKGRPRAGDVLLLTVPPAAFFAGFWLSARSVIDFILVERIITSVMNAPFAEQYQSGPPHRPLTDLFVLSPLVCLLAVAAAGLFTGRDRPANRWIVVALVTATLLPFALLSSKNVRYVVMVDPLLRIMGASFLVSLVEMRRTAAAAAFLAVNAVAELATFHSLFIAQEIYDPVTVNLMKGFHMIPR